MKLLLDANLSWRLIKLLAPEFGQVEHVDRCGLPVPATDTEVWNWAKQNDALIVTNDEDYYYFSLQKGFPPKVVLLRMGNQSTQNVLNVLTRNRDKIRMIYESPDYGLIEIL